MKANQVIFADYEADFYHYMLTVGGLQKKTSRDYISRMRFLSDTYTLDNHFTKEKMEDIIAKERVLMATRDRYNTDHAVGDLQACLRKFLDFVNFDYGALVKKVEEEEVSKVEADQTLNETERKQIVKSRLGQGDFINGLIEYWQGCSVSGFKMTRLLVASHIMPWRVANNDQRLDVFNGLLLLPNYDKLFDIGYITFGDDGEIKLSRFFDKESQRIIGVNADTHLLKVSSRHTYYLEYHRENVFLG